MSKKDEAAVKRAPFGVLRYSLSTGYDHNAGYERYFNLSSIASPLPSVVDKSSYRPTADSELKRSNLAAGMAVPPSSAVYDFPDGKDTGFRVFANLSDDVVERTQKLDNALSVINEEITANQEMKEEVAAEIQQRSSQPAQSAPSAPAE